ncbi:dehydrase and lipid transport-domain-containing protein [Apodospora peruviana]|uniref:Dehydrase and lipid transport-domain-containing protein n=1 Tax=Apodospora peruviana TaxID=516989 RepID=A0AAE0IK51_9PEZI|nr:dehydrase and lipid transport-domain-containing protein [Apodospora peruviana]
MASSLAVSTAGVHRRLLSTSSSIQRASTLFSLKIHTSSTSRRNLRCNNLINSPNTRRNSSWLSKALPNLPTTLLPNNLSLSSAPITLSEKRRLPYPPSEIFKLIADVGSYRTFLPHCSSSRVTSWATTPDNTSQKFPAVADLTVGWGPFTETYTSRVYCVPPNHKSSKDQGLGVVEAVSGNAFTSIPPETLRRLGYSSSIDVREIEQMGGLFESLVTRWTVRPVLGRNSGSTSGELSSAEGEGETEVSLEVRFQFANALLGQTVGALAKEKVDEMVQAFEDRARALYGTPNGNGKR